MQMTASGGGNGIPNRPDSSLIKPTKQHAYHPVVTHSGYTYRRTQPKPVSRPAYHAPSYNAYGMNSAKVMDLQRRLGISADGIYGPQTKAAVMAYQRSHGLAVDGIAGSQTWGSLLNGSVSHASKPKVIRPTIVHSTPKTVSKPKVVKPKPSMPTPKPGSQNSSIIDNINKEYDTMQKKQLADLKAQNDKAIGDINNQKKQTSAEYYDKRNQSDVVSNQNAQKLREIMANNGLNTSGENVTANVNLNNARQQSLANLNQQQQIQNDAYAKQIASINDPAKQQAIENSIASQRAQALAQAQWNQYTFNNLSASQKSQQAWQQYTYNNMSAAQKAQFDQNSKQFGQQMAWNMYQLNSNNAAQSALAQQQINAYQAGFNGSGGGGDLPYNFKSDEAKAINMAHIPQSQLPAFNWVIQHESSYNANAKNPSSTAHGYGQFLDSTAKEWDARTGLHYNSSPVDQLVETYDYMVSRYGSPQKAMAFWQKNHWY